MKDERIFPLPSTDEAKIASVQQAMDQIRSGSTRRYTIDEMRAKHPAITKPYGIVNLI